MRRRRLCAQKHLKIRGRHADGNIRVIWQKTRVHPHSGHARPLLAEAIPLPAAGVKVEVADDIAMVELAINMKYGYSIPKTCKQVQEKVMQAINSMTGLTVKQVNVRIAGVSLEQD